MRGSKLNYAALCVFAGGRELLNFIHSACAAVSGVTVYVSSCARVWVYVRVRAILKRPKALQRVLSLLLHFCFNYSGRFFCSMTAVTKLFRSLKPRVGLDLVLNVKIMLSFNYNFTLCHLNLA